MDIDSEISKFRRDWEIDFPGRTIKRRKQNFLKAIGELIWKPKYPIIALYRFAQHHLSTEEGIVWPNFIERSKGNDVAGVPSWFELSEKWNIPKKDLELLYIGPLVKGGSVLVPALPEKGFFTSIWQLLTALAIIGGAIGFFVMVYKFIFWVINVSIWGQSKNFWKKTCEIKGVTK